MNTDSRKQLLRNDLEDLYKKCSDICKTIIRANKLSEETSFVLLKYFHFDSLFKLVETRKIKSITVVGPAKSHYKYEAFWIKSEQPENLFLTSDFAVIYLNTNTTQFLYTVPVWSNFLKRIIRLFRGAKVTYTFC